MEFYKGIDFVSQDIKEPPYLLKPLIPTSGIVLFHGAAGIGKSTVIWQMANAIVEGGKFLALPTIPTKVLLINLDMPKFGLYHRWRESGFKPLFDLVIMEPFDCTTVGFRYSDSYRKLQEIVELGQYGLVITDALGEVHLQSGNRDDIPGQVYAMFRHWFPKRCLLFIHHDRKRKVTDSGMMTPMEEDAAGSQYWRSYATVTVHLYRANENIVVMKHDKSQIGPLLEPIQLYMNDNATELVEWSDQTQQEEALKLAEAESNLKQKFAEWDKWPVGKKVKELSLLLGKSRATVYRWRRAQQGEGNVI